MREVLGKSLRLRAGVALWLCAWLVPAGTFNAAAAPLPSVAEHYHAIWHSFHEEQEALQRSNWTTKDGYMISPIAHATLHVAKLLTLAENHPKDPATGGSLLRVATSYGHMQDSERVESLLRNHWPGASDYLDVLKEYEAVEQDPDRKPCNFTGRFLAIAQDHPRTPVAAQALTWVVQWGHRCPEFDKALQILRRDHVKAATMDDVCASLAYSTSAHAEDLLRAVAKENPDRAAQGNALLSLARVLDRQADLVRSLQKPGNDSQLKWMESTYGQERLATWRKADPGKYEQEAEQLFEHVAEGFGDVASHFSKLGDAAKAELFEKRSLVVGKVAPQIEGEDMDGKRFKLSDYRGKVVVIDFWGDW